MKQNLFIKRSYLITFIIGVVSSCKQHRGDKEGIHLNLNLPPAQLPVPVKAGVEPA